MKKKSSAEKVCEPQAEYQLDKLLPDGVQGKYVERYRKGTNLILLEPGIAKPGRVCNVLMLHTRLGSQTMNLFANPMG